MKKNLHCKKTRSGFRDWIKKLNQKKQRPSVDIEKTRLDHTWILKEDHLKEVRDSEQEWVLLCIYSGARKEDSE